MRTIRKNNTDGTILVIGVEDGWSSKRLLNSFEQLGARARLLEMQDVTLDLPDAGLRWKNEVLEDIRAIVVKKIGGRYSSTLLSRLDVLEHLRVRCGVPVFSEPVAMRLALDRLSCTLRLQRAEIPMPRTRITESLQVAKKTVEEYGTAVLKPLYTSKARGMKLLKSAPGLESELRKYQQNGNSVFYLQQFVPHAGRDLGVVFLGGEYLGAYARVSGDSWNTTIREGGHYAEVNPSAEVIELARRAQAAFGLSFTGVDVVEAPDGPLIYEVSAFGGFRGLHEASGLDAAMSYARWVLENL